MTTIQIVVITGRPHTLTFAPYATIQDLRSQINTKFRITSDLYWLSCCGKPLFDSLLLEEIRGTVFMHGRLMGGVHVRVRTKYGVGHGPPHGVGHGVPWGRPWPTPWGGPWPTPYFVLTHVHCKQITFMSSPHLFIPSTLKGLMRRTTHFGSLKLGVH